MNMAVNVVFFGVGDGCDEDYDACKIRDLGAEFPISIAKKIIGFLEPEDK